MAVALDWPAGTGRLVLPEVDSTMAEAARRAPSLTAPTWIMAEVQTAARGRQGRAWRSTPENFAATLVMRPGGPAAAAALRSFVAALALRDAFAAALGDAAPFALKWPNDVLLNGGKVAGILLERLGDGALLIGIGVNLAVAPTSAEVEEGAVPPVAVADALGAAPTPRAFLDTLAPAFAARETQLVAQGFASLREDWLAHAARLGDVIRARVGADTYHGTFETVDDEGRLILRTAKGRREIAAADIYF
ncbi:MAG: biotin--[acetyl-CoA-carboxylase] ligase [Pseudomonadota bacterium]